MIADPAIVDAPSAQRFSLRNPRSPDHRRADPTIRFSGGRKIRRGHTASLARELLDHGES